MVRLNVERELDIFDGFGVWNRYSFYRGPCRVWLAF